MAHPVSRGVGRPRPPTPPRRTVVAARSTPARPSLAANVAAAPPADAPAGYSPFDYSSDPILQQAKALANRNIASAQSSELAQRQSALIQYGFDPNLGSLYGDENAAGAAKANPFSTLALLSRQHEARARGIDESRNRENLFYSSTRGQDIQNEGTQYLGDQASAAANLRAALGGYSGQLAGAQQTEQGNVLSAEEAAYQRALDYALRYGGTGGGNGGTPRTVAPAPAPVRPRATPPRPAVRVSRPRPAGRQP